MNANKHKKLEKFKKILFVDLVIQTYKNWREDRTLRLGAGLAYYAMFAIVPLITLMVGVAAFFYSVQDIQDFTINTINSIFGNELSATFSENQTNTIADESENVLSSLGIIGIASLFITASFIFVALQDALDVVWKNPVRIGFLKWVKRYIWAYIIVLISSLLLFAALVVQSASAVAEYLIPGELILLESIADLLVSIGSWATGILVMALIFKLLIYQKVSWIVLIIGATVTSLLVVVGTWALGLYIINVAGNSLSGAIGAVLLVLLWVYYEAQIILIGAQFMRVIDLNIDRLPILNRFQKKIKK